MYKLISVSCLPIVFCCMFGPTLAAQHKQATHQQQQIMIDTTCDKPAVSNTDAALGAALLGALATAYIKDNPQTKDYLAGAGLGGLAGYLVANHYNKKNCEQKEDRRGTDSH